MNFCATCGRRRTGDTRFCGGCGAEFAAGAEAPPSPAAETAAPLADEPTRWDPPVESTRLETTPADWGPADTTRVARQPDAASTDTQGSAPGPFPAAPAAPPEPDPFAAWFAADPPDGKAPSRDEPAGTWQQPADPWQSADTVYAAPGQRAPAYPPPQPPPPPYGAQQAQLPGGQPSSSGKRAVFIIVVVLVMLAAGGGAYALVSRSNQHNTSQPPAPTVTARSSNSASAKASASASTSASPATSASASASASPGVVSLGPSVAGSNPAEPAVEKTLTDYFQGINTHNYAEYASSLDAQQRALQPESQFTSGYSSTSDSGMKLISLASSGNGGLAATVTFTSHQTAGTGADGSSCNNWTLTFYLVKQGADYLKGAAPSGYQPTYSDC